MRIGRTKDRAAPCIPVLGDALRHVGLRVDMSERRYRRLHEGRAACYCGQQVGNCDPRPVSVKTVRSDALSVSRNPCSTCNLAIERRLMPEYSGRGWLAVALCCDMPPGHEHPLGAHSEGAGGAVTNRDRQLTSETFGVEAAGSSREVSSRLESF